jgi:proteasome lid subunit RPN8/RPN11
VIPSTRAPKVGPRSGRGQVVVRSALRPALVRHARAEQPRECCGLLVGRGRHVQFAVPFTNIASNPARYRVDDASHITLRRTLRAFVPPLEIVGVYHSHPQGAAWPSERDVRDAFYPDWLHLIVGLGSRKTRVRAFRLRGGRIRPLTILWSAR